MQRTLVLIKPEGVKRHLTGKIIQRFEDAGLKIIGMKQIWANEETAKKHYTEDISKRKGEQIRNSLLKYICEGPIIAFVLEGINAIENVRKMVGGTEPKSAPPGTIRGDFAHISFSYADSNNLPVKNLIHASSDEKDAGNEISVWFNEKELHSYDSIQNLLL